MLGEQEAVRVVGWGPRELGCVEGGRGPSFGDRVSKGS